MTIENAATCISVNNQLLLCRRRAGGITHHCMRDLQNLRLRRLRVEVFLRRTPNPQHCSCPQRENSSGVRTWYTSYVSSDDVAINSAEVADVTARKSTTRSAAAPVLPRIAAAAADAGRPAETSAGLSTRMSGSPRSATAARPSVVENMNGIANHASPPSRYAFTHVAGRLAIARCQYYERVG